ncbi:MAG: hypothetical protein GF416_03100 [Candidatus Altiarchaeales archaeon]|nr:hypothetical protein [Candidatus Altiarchaeales archaeon]MBD3416108.1 hypothetical protein [Candidatus Altiarchaeales archaeon]
MGNRQVERRQEGESEAQPPGGGIQEPVESLNVDRRRFTRRTMLKGIGLTVAAGFTGLGGTAGTVYYLANRRESRFKVDHDTVATSDISELDGGLQRQYLNRFLGRYGSPIHRRDDEPLNRSLVEVTRVQTRDGREHVDLTFIPEWKGEWGKSRDYLDAEPVTFRCREGENGLELEGIVSRAHWGLVYVGADQLDTHSVNDRSQPLVVMSKGVHTPIMRLADEKDWVTFIPDKEGGTGFSKVTYYIQSGYTGGELREVRGWQIGRLEEGHVARERPWH